MKKLLVATDLSARSDRAVERAVHLARRRNAALTVLHVLDENLPAAAVSQVTAAAEHNIESYLATLSGRGSVVIAVRTVTGNAFQAIIEAAERDACDLIVLGRHRNESGEAAFGGTTMSRVIRLSRHPVLLVSERPQGDYSRVMVGVDFSPFSRVALRAALALAPGAEFHAVHAFDVSFQGFLQGTDTRRQVEAEHEQALSRFIEEEMPALAGIPGDNGSGGLQIGKILRQGDVTGVLRHEVGRLHPDLLAVGTHGRSGLVGAVLGSVAQNLLDHPPCDLLVVKGPPGQ